jgi:L-iditol 2-dehydrogenase
MVFPIDESTKYEHGALVEPVACAQRSIYRLNIGSGERVVVFGGGFMGLLHTIFAKRRGAQVILAEPDENRRQQALTFGADCVVDPNSDDFVERVFDYTHGSGGEKIAVACSVPAALKSAISVAGKGAIINCYASFHPKGTEISFDPGIIHEKEVTITGTKSQTLQDVQRASDLISQGIPELDRLIQRTYRLENIQQALDETAKGGIYRSVVVM